MRLSPRTQRRALAMGLLTIIVLTAMAARAVFIKQEYFAAVSATDVNTAVSFGFNGYVLLINDGADSVYVSLVGTTATTADFELKSGESLAPSDPTTGVGLLCATSDTATVRVFATERGI